MLALLGVLEHAFSPRIPARPTQMQVILLAVVTADAPKGGRRRRGDDH
jgi:hypothetical protein